MASMPLAVFTRKKHAVKKKMSTVKWRHHSRMQCSSPSNFGFRIQTRSVATSVAKHWHHNDSSESFMQSENCKAFPSGKTCSKQLLQNSLENSTQSWLRSWDKLFWTFVCECLMFDGVWRTNSSCNICFNVINAAWMCEWATGDGWVGDGLLMSGPSGERHHSCRIREPEQQCRNTINCHWFSQPKKFRVHETETFSAECTCCQCEQDEWVYF